MIANNAIHAGVVRGSGLIKPDKNLTTDLQLIYDGVVVESWTKKRWPDDIIGSIEWLTKELYKIGQTLKKGDLVLTGAFGLPIPIDDKTNVEVRSSALGNVSAKFI